MTTPLYDLTARNYVQFMTAALGCLEKAKAHYTKQGKDYHQLVSKSLHEDMLPLHFQVITIVHFSEAAIAAAQSGVMGGPDMSLNMNYDELKIYLTQARDRIANIEPSKINELADGEVIFKYGDVTLPFTTKDFFLSYALPSFYFHISVTYSIFRSLGVPVGIANYLGIVQSTPSDFISDDIHQLTGEEYLKILEPLAELKLNDIA